MPAGLGFIVQAILGMMGSQSLLHVGALSVRLSEGFLVLMAVCSVRSSCDLYLVVVSMVVLSQYKKGDRARAVNYRPISLTSHVIKIYERVLRKTMVNFIEDNNILCDNQHGFRSGRSCLTQMLSHFDDIMLGLLNGHDTDAIYLDFAKAFDKKS